MFPLPQAMLMINPATIIFQAPLNNITTSTDITTNPLTATVVKPTNATITYSDTAVTVNTRLSPGSFPSISWGNNAASTKLAPNLYPTKSVTMSVYANATGILNGSGANSDGCTFLSFNWVGGTVNWFFYVTPSTTRLYVNYASSGATGTSVLVGTIPPGENKYSIEWDPSGTIKWQLNNTISHTTTVARPTGQGQLRTSISGFKGEYYGGVYEVVMRELVYSVT